MRNPVFVQPFFGQALGKPLKVRWSPAPYGKPFMGQAKSTERPSGVIGKVDALDAVKKLGQVTETAPECFEGEDLTIAKSIVDRLKTFSGSEQSIMGLSVEDERVLKRGLDCFITLERSKVKGVEAESSEFPLIPVLVGAGVGLVLLVIVIAA
jgi:hypothetical protein